jgi:prophage regulatory protein
MQQLLPKKRVRELVGFSFAHIDRLEAANRFPKRVRIGYRVFWVAEEVDAWIRHHIGQRSR